MALAISMGWAARPNGIAATKAGSMFAIGSIAGVTGADRDLLRGGRVQRDVGIGDLR
jgi:hypothetical protein